MKLMSIFTATLIGISMLGWKNVEAGTIEGFTEPNVTVDISATESGVFVSIPCSVGDRVEARQIVAELDSKVLQSSLAIAEHRARSTAALNMAKANLDLMSKTLQQYRLLKERNASSEFEYFRAEAEFEKAKATVLQAREQIRSAELERDRIVAQIEKRRIRTPISGIVSSVNRRVGEAHSAADPRILTIVNLQQLKATFAVTPSQRYLLRNAKKLSVEFPESGLSSTGTVESIAPIIDAKSGTFDVVVVIKNHDGKFKSGSRCVLLLVDDNNAS